MKINTPSQDILRPVYNFAENNKIKLYLVGGILRDMLLGREKENPDFDFSLRKDSINFGRKLAGVIKAGFVVLDREHGACRLVKKTQDKIYTMDFMDFRGPTLEDDLKHRDFTINCLALKLEDAFGQSLTPDSLIDPYGAKKDLKLKIIRAVNKKTFDEDPLRILRAFSLAAIFSFEIGAETLNLIKSKKEKLSGVSCERIRDELFKILERPDAFGYLYRMDTLGVLRVFIPEIDVMRRVKQGPYHHLDVLRHTWETLKQLECLLPQLRKNRDVRDYLSEVISSDRKRYTLIKLAALLHDIGKPKAMRREGRKITFPGHERVGFEIGGEIIKRLRLSNDELDALGKMVLWHLRPGYLADNPLLSARARFRFFRDTATEAVSVLLLSLADQRATKGKLTSKVSRLRHEKVVAALIKEYFRRKKEKKLPRLISGDDLLQEFKLEPSPLIGKILSEVEELQAIGRIKTKQEAFKAAGKFV